MGNFKILETDFIRRTLALIDQYEELKELYVFDQQYNHTLLTNCLLGLAIFPKEKILPYVPKEKIQITKVREGFNNSLFDVKLIKDTKDLIMEMRDSAAHFNIAFVSNDEKFHIDRVHFINDRHNIVVADFDANELLPFIRWFATELLTNYERAKSEK